MNLTVKDKTKGLENIKQLVVDQFRLPTNSIHGVYHWRRVEALGLYIADSTGADKEVVQYFAYLHDSQRDTEDDDLKHGLVAKDYILRLVDQHLLFLTSSQLDQLTEACATHTTCRKQPTDPSIATCIDADRLDLWRMGIEPSPQLLYTDVGKQISQDKLIYDQIVGEGS